MKVEYRNLHETIEKLKQRSRGEEEKLRKILAKLAYEGYEVASAGFMNAAYPGTNDVQVRVVWEDAMTVQIIASGSAVMFIEFGAGKFNPEHPKQHDYPGIVGHGEYGKKKGANPKGWIYEGERGTGYAQQVVRRTKHGVYPRVGRWRTWGNQPARAMYDASKHIHEKIEEIIKGVYGDD